MASDETSVSSIEPGTPVTGPSGPGPEQESPKKSLLDKVRDMRKDLKGKLDPKAQVYAENRTQRQLDIQAELKVQDVVSESNAVVSRATAMANLSQELASNASSIYQPVFKGLSVTHSELVNNPELAYTIIKFISNDEYARNPFMLSRIMLEATHRGGKSDLAVRFRTKLFSLYKKMSTNTEENSNIEAIAINAAKKALIEIRDRVSTGDTAYEAKYGKRQTNGKYDGELDAELFNEILSEEIPPEEFKDKFCNLVKGRELLSASGGQDGPENRETRNLDLDDYTDQINNSETMTNPEFEPMRPHAERLRGFINRLREMGQHARLSLHELQTQQEQLEQLDFTNAPEIQAIQNQLIYDLRDAILLGQRGSEGFHTQNSTFLTPEQQFLISQGPQGWERVLDSVLEDLTADPIGDIEVDMTIHYKMSALKDYITTQGIGFLEREGLTRTQAQVLAHRWKQLVSREFAEQVAQHGVLKRLLLSTDAKASADIYKQIPIRWLENLTGRGIDPILQPERRRLTMTANRFYDQALMNFAGEKARRWFFLQHKKTVLNQPLSRDEQADYNNGYFLTEEDLIGQINMTQGAEFKSRGIQVWNMVKNKAGSDRSLSASARELRIAWENVPANERVARIDEQFTDSDYKLFNQLHFRYKTQIESGEPIENILSLTPGEFKHKTDYILSPAEQRVYQDMLAHEQSLVAREVDYDIREGNVAIADREKTIISKLDSRKSYIVDGIRRARQHYIFTHHHQKIDVAFATLPKEDGRMIQGLYLEKEMRAMHQEQMMRRRYDEYSQLIIQDMSGMSRLLYMTYKLAKDTRLASSPHWHKLMIKMLVNKDAKHPDSPNSLPVLYEAIEHIKQETGIPYELMAEPTMTTWNSTPYESGWRILQGAMDPIISRLDSQGKQGSITNPNRFEAALGAQIRTPGDVMTYEAERADGFSKTVLELVRRIEEEQEATGHISGGSQLVSEAARHLGQRFIDSHGHPQSKKAKDALSALKKVAQLAKDTGDERIISVFYLGKIDDIKELAKNSQYEQHETILSEAVKQKDNFDKLVKDELTIERKKYMLDQLAFRLPGVLSAYFVEDIGYKFDEILLGNPAIRARLDAVEPSKQADEFFSIREQLWRVLEQSLRSSQEEVIRDLAGTERVDSYFSLDDPTTTGKNLGFFLEQNINQLQPGFTFNEYQQSFGEMTGYLRHYFELMRQGKAGKASIITTSGDNLQQGLNARWRRSINKEESIEIGALTSQENRAVLGKRQFDLFTRMPMDVNLSLGDMLFEEVEMQKLATASVYRANGEFAGLVDASNQISDIMINVHRHELDKIAEQIDVYVRNLSGWSSPGDAAVPGRALIEAWIEMVKGSDILSLVPGLEQLARGAFESDAKLIKEIGGKFMSRVALITENPSAAILQTNEIKEKITEVLHHIDALMGTHHATKAIEKKFNLTPADLSTFAVRRAFSYLGYGMFIYILWQAYKQAAEEFKKG